VKKLCVLSDVAGHGGAAGVASQIAGGLGDTFDITRFAIAARKGAPSEWASLPANYYANVILHGRLKTRAPKIGYALSHSLLLNALRKAKPDIISLHNIHAADENIDFLKTCLSIAPVVWTLHDMWSFTGRCAYSFGCESFITGCDIHCPTPNVRPAMAPEKIRGAWEKKMAFFDAAPAGLHAVSPSAWLAQLATQRAWRADQLSIIHNGVDTAVFQPSDRARLRAKHVIPSDRPIVLFFLAHPNDRFKTAELALPALNFLSKTCTVITFGAGDGLLEAGSAFRRYGLVRSKATLAELYALSDLFILSSTAENYPTVILESLATGTPCIGFDVGGIPEMIVNEKTGWLAGYPNGNGLKSAAEKAIQLVAFRGEAIRVECVQSILEKNTLYAQNNAYKKLFLKLIDGKAVD
jgi:glycosyltransferase involved in cell wall biosynthesis